MAKDNSPFKKRGKVYTYEEWAPAAGPNPQFVKELTQQERIDIIKQTSTPEEFPMRLSKIAASYPGMSTGTMVGLAQFGADGDALAAAARLDSYAQGKMVGAPSTGSSLAAGGAASYDYLQSIGKDEQTASEKDKKDALWFAGLKTATRYLTTALYTPLQIVTNTARQADAAWNQWYDKGQTDKGPVVAGEKALDFSQIIKDTYLYQNVVEGKDLGQGYFWGGEALEETERIAAQIATVNGKAYTPGRAIEGMVGIDPGERGYGILSGIVDGAIAIGLDPVAVAGRLKNVKDLAKFNETARAGRSAAQPVIAEIQSAEEIARTEARIIANERTLKARTKYRESEAELREFYAKALEDARVRDEMLVNSVGTPVDAQIENIRRINNLDDLYERRELLLQQAKDVKDGKFLARDAEGSKLLTAKQSKRFISRELGKIDKQINSVLDLVYLRNDPVTAKILEVQQANVRKAADEYNARFDGVKTREEIAEYVEKRRAGILETSTGYSIAKEDAKNWFSEGNADVLFQEFADATSAYEINQLSKGKFGAEISGELAAAKTIDDVERILLPRLGLQVLPDIERGIPARYIVEPLKNFVLRSGVVKTATEKYGRAISTALDYMPTGRPVKLDDTEALAEETRRWMKAARYEDADIAKVWDEIASSDPQNYRERQSIITRMLTATANKYSEELNLSERGKREIRKMVQAYESQLSGLVQYASRRVTEDGKTFIDDVELPSDMATSIAQFASEIVLPDVYKLREYTGGLSKVARMVDNATGSEKEIAEKTAYAAARFTRSLSDGFLRSVLLVFRPAFVIRNIMEMQTRSFLAGGMNLVTDPVATATLVMSSKGTRARLAELARNSDPYLVDINGRRFMDQGLDNSTSQEHVDSFFNTMQERGFSFDARSARGAINSGGFGLIKLLDNGSNSAPYADALAHRLMLHRADPIKRAIIAQELPPKYMKLVQDNRLTFEDAFVQAVRDGLFKKQVDVMGKSSEELQRLLSTAEGMKMLFFTGSNSYRNQMLQDTLGNAAWRNFIATGKITTQKVRKVKDQKTGLTGELIEDVDLFEMSPDYIKNSKVLKKLIDDELVEGTEAFTRAQQLELPSVSTTFLDKSKYNQWSDAFFRMSARVETRAVYGPEYRVGYWESVATMAPLMSREAAQAFLKNAEDIKKTKVMIENADGTVSYMPWTKNNPAFADIVEASKNGKGTLTLDEIDAYARDRAAKRISNMYYDALQKRNFVYAMQLVVPFANAWANTIIKWAEFSKSPSRIASRVMPAVNLFDTLQSEESAAIYDVIGTKHDPSQGFIHENLYGEKVFTLPLTGNLRTLFGLFGNPEASDITIPVQSMNLLLAGADLPGSDIGITPGVGTQWNILYSVLPSSIKESIPPVVGNIIAPYGDKAGKPLAFLPAWAQKSIGAFFNTEEAMNKFAKPIMAYEASANPEFQQLYNGTPLSVEERALLQEKLATEAQRQSRWMYGMQGLLQAVLPGTPLMEYYGKNENGDSFFQWQMAKALNDLIEIHDGNYEMAYQEYSTMFGRQALLATMSNKKDNVWATDRAWQFATANPTAFKAYADVLPYFFAGSDFSSEYKVAMTRRGRGDVLSPNEVLAESDRLMISAAKGQLTVYAARNGLGAQWIDDQMKKFKMDTLQGYEPEVTVSTNKLAQKILKVESALQRPEFANTPAGKAAVEFSNARKAALQQAAARYPDRDTPSLGGADNADLRYKLEEIGQRLSKDNPDFANLYQRVYLQELRKD